MSTVQSNNDEGSVKNRQNYSIILALFSFGVIIAFVYYLHVNADKYLNLLRVSLFPVILLLLLTLPSPFLNGIVNTYMFRSLGANLTHAEGFLLAATSTLANQLPISGGIVAKGMYLKRKYDLSYTKYLSATLALFFCTVAINGFIGLIILIYWFLFENLTVSPILFVGFSAMTASILVFWVPLDKMRVPDTLLKRVRQALEGWMFISANPVLVSKILMIQTGMMLLFAIRYWLAFHMLSQNVTFSQVVLFSAASILTQLVSFAPGGLGVREVIVASVASVLGFDIGTSVVAVGLDRMVSTIVVVLIGWISMIILGRKFSQT